MELTENSVVEISGEVPPVIQLPWTAFSQLTQLEDYHRVHLCAVVLSVCDVTLSQLGYARLSIRVKDRANDVIDIVAWRKCADVSLWTEHSKVEIFFGQVNKERQIVELSDESRVSPSTNDDFMFNAFGTTHFINWGAAFKRTKKQ